MRQPADYLAFWGGVHFADSVEEGKRIGRGGREKDV